jgi:hypothetical protein
MGHGAWGKTAGSRQQAAPRQSSGQAGSEQLGTKDSFDRLRTSRTRHDKKTR